MNFLMFFLFDGCVPFQYFMRSQTYCGCIMVCRCHRRSIDGMLSVRYLILQLTDPSEFWTLWCLSLYKGVFWVLLLYPFSNKGPYGVKMDVSVICTWRSDFDGISLNEFLRKKPFRKMHSYCLTYRFLHKRCRTGVN